MIGAWFLNASSHIIQKEISPDVAEKWPYFHESQLNTAIK